MRGLTDPVVLQILCDMVFADQLSSTVKSHARMQVTTFLRALDIAPCNTPDRDVERIDPVNDRLRIPKLRRNRWQLHRSRSREGSLRALSKTI
jgi:hypothetical protein